MDKVVERRKSKTTIGQKFGWPLGVSVLGIVLLQIFSNVNRIPDAMIIANDSHAQAQLATSIAQQSLEMTRETLEIVKEIQHTIYGNGNDGLRTNVAVVSTQVDMMQGHIARLQRQMTTLERMMVAQDGG